MFWVGLAAMTIGALSSRCWINRLPLAKLAKVGATGSYAFYLVHKPLIHIAREVAPNWHGVQLLILSILFSIAGTAFLYVSIEKPFFKLARENQC